MSVRVYKPVTSGRRGMTSRDLSGLTKHKPSKTLLRTKRTITGRSRGSVTVRHRGGGSKRFYRLVDFKMLAEGEYKVKAIEYDPNRSSHIALLETEAGIKSYVLAGTGMKVGQKLKSGIKTDIKPGNRMSLASIPTGTSIYNIELTPGRGGQLVRSAGTSAQLTAKDNGFGLVKLPSGEVRLIPLAAFATIGSVGNESHQHIKWGTAGRRRRLGWRPTVHGKSMNPVDHPLGGGEGHTGPGRLPRTPWGKMAIGAKTRKRKSTTKYIVRTRHQSKRR